MQTFPSQVPMLSCSAACSVVPVARFLSSSQRRCSRCFSTSEQLPPAEHPHLEIVHPPVGAKPGVYSDKFPNYSRTRAYHSVYLSFSLSCLSSSVILLCVLCLLRESASNIQSAHRPPKGNAFSFFSISSVNYIFHVLLHVPYWCCSFRHS